MKLTKITLIAVMLVAGTAHAQTPMKHQDKLQAMKSCKEFCQNSQNGSCMDTCIEQGPCALPHVDCEISTEPQAGKPKDKAEEKKDK